jgi:DNA-binding transcriptional regulator YhcF (GntR family)
MIVYKSFIRVVEFKNSGVPKYRQLAFAIVQDIEQGKLELGDWLPSANDYADLNNISKNTVLKAFCILRQKNIVTLNMSRRFMVINNRPARLFGN